jgi:hypothetical protein
MIFGLSSVGQAYGQANMTGENVTAMPPDGNMTAGENATITGGVSGIGSGGDDDDGGGGTNLAVNDPGASGTRATK